jgi:flagellar basal-body rod protein FlgF/flagellar basal-body rod protein FlgG
MPYGLYLSAEGAQVQDQRLDVIANNLANVDTIGFKRQMTLFQARAAEAIEQGLLSPGLGGVEDVGGGVSVQQTMTDFSHGPLKHTKDPKHLAIEGEGFFLVRKGDETLLTRAGNFRLTSTGELVTQQGYPVISAAGGSVAVNPDSPRWTITSTGTLQQEGGATLALALVRPGSYEELQHAGENLFRPLAEPAPLAPEERRVAQGYLELSTVEPTLEMIAMIEASRALEANLNLMKAQDQMIGGLVNRVMKV